jgi:hypothetical protein
MGISGWQTGNRVKTLKPASNGKIMEELGVDIVDLNHLESVYHDYSDFSLTLHGYTCPFAGKHPFKRFTDKTSTG